MRDFGSRLLSDEGKKIEKRWEERIIPCGKSHVEPYTLEPRVYVYMFLKNRVYEHQVDSWIHTHFLVYLGPGALQNLARITQVDAPM